MEFIIWVAQIRFDSTQARIREGGCLGVQTPPKINSCVIYILYFIYIQIINPPYFFCILTWLHIKVIRSLNKHFISQTRDSIFSCFWPNSILSFTQYFENWYRYRLFFTIQYSILLTINIIISVNPDKLKY